MAKIVASHYDLLGVDIWADDRRINTAYRRLARSAHPDANPGLSPEDRARAHEHMASLNEARRVLTDPIQRFVYNKSSGILDRRGKVPNWVPPPPPSGFGLYPHGYRSGGFSMARLADEAHRALSLIALSRDLSPLESRAPNGVWKLTAGRAPITDEDLRHLSTMASLMVLDLSLTKVTDAGLEHLLTLERLDELILWGTAITDEGLRTIARMESLGSLGLAHTKITDKGLANLRPLVNLESLDLRGTKVRGPGAAHLFDLPSLEFVALPFWMRPRWRMNLRKALARTG